MKSYIPSNGTEGMWFAEKFCEQCIHCNPDPSKKPQCDIMARAWLHGINDKEYPTEWVYDENGEPTCLAHVKWDWGNDGDPEDPDNPNAPPPPPDPNQLNLFPLYPDETVFEKQRSTKKQLV